MLFTTTASLLALAIGAAAIPTSSSTRNSLRSKRFFPPPTSSRGFKLVANVTNLSLDLSPSIHGYLLTGAHTGAGDNAAVFTNNSTSGGITFYQNGTVSEEYPFMNATILSDSGTPLSPYGLQVPAAATDAGDAETIQQVTIDAGPGTPGVIIPIHSPYPYPYVDAIGGSFMACAGTLPYYGPDWHFVLLDFVRPALVDGELKTVVPPGCVAITLLPQCATLEDLPAGSHSSHEFADEVPCYEDVLGFDWNA